MHEIPISTCTVYLMSKKTTLDRQNMCLGGIF